MATGEVVPTSSGSRLIIRTQMHPQGLLRPLAPLLRRYMQHAGTATSPPSRPDSTTQTTQPPIHILVSTRACSPTPMRSPRPSKPASPTPCQTPPSTGRGVDGGVADPEQAVQASLLIVGGPPVTSAPGRTEDVQPTRGRQPLGGRTDRPVGPGREVRRARGRVAPGTMTHTHARSGGGDGPLPASASGCLRIQQVPSQSDCEGT